MGFSIQHLVVLLIIVILLFGTKKIKNVGADVGGWIRDFKKAMQYAERIECGVVKVNQISTGLALQAPFGGVKDSSTDSYREQGTAALDFYSRTKTVYFDYSA